MSNPELWSPVESRRLKDLRLSPSRIIRSRLRKYVEHFRGGGTVYGIAKVGEVSPGTARKIRILTQEGKLDWILNREVGKQSVANGYGNQPQRNVQESALVKHYEDLHSAVVEIRRAFLSLNHNLSKDWIPYAQKLTAKDHRQRRLWDDIQEHTQASALWKNLENYEKGADDLGLALGQLLTEVGEIASELGFDENLDRERIEQSIDAGLKKRVPAVRAHDSAGLRRVIRYPRKLAIQISKLRSAEEVRSIRQNLLVLTDEIAERMAEFELVHRFPGCCRDCPRADQKV